MSVLTDSGDTTITISTDDKLIAIIEPNIRKTSHKKSMANIIKTLTLIAHGTPKTTSCKLTGISIHTLHKWCREPWYDQAVEIIRDKLDEELDAALTGIAHKATTAVIDRLDNGDWVFDRSGNQVRKPISAKDAMLVAGISYDKRALKRGKPTSISEATSEEDRLTKLAQKFKKMAGGDIVDAEYEEVSSDTEER